MVQDELGKKISPFFRKRKCCSSLYDERAIGAREWHWASENADSRKIELKTRDELEAGRKELDHKVGFQKAVLRHRQKNKV